MMTLYHDFSNPSGSDASQISAISNTESDRSTSRTLADSSRANRSTTGNDASHTPALVESFHVSLI